MKQKLLYHFLLIPAITCTTIAWSQSFPVIYDTSILNNENLQLAEYHFDSSLYKQKISWVKHSLEHPDKNRVVVKTTTYNKQGKVTTRLIDEKNVVSFQEQIQVARSLNQIVVTRVARKEDIGNISKNLPRLYPYYNNLAPHVAKLDSAYALTVSTYRLQGSNVISYATTLNRKAFSSGKMRETHQHQHTQVKPREKLTTTKKGDTTIISKSTISAGNAYSTLDVNYYFQQRLVKNEFFNESKTEKSRSRVVLYYYDHSGKKIREEHWTGDMRIHHRTVSYGFDPEMNRSIYFDERFNTKGHTISCDVYFDDGRIIEQHKMTFVGRPISNKTTFSYYDNGLKQKIETWSEGKLVERETFEYKTH